MTKRASELQPPPESEHEVERGDVFFLLVVLLLPRGAPFTSTFGPQLAGAGGVSSPAALLHAYTPGAHTGAGPAEIAAHGPDAILSFLG